MNATPLKSVKLFVAAAALVCAGQVLAQSSTTSPAKKELITKLLTMQQAGIETLARTVLQAPVGQLMQGASSAVRQMPAEKREAAAKAIEADVKKFVDDNGPFIRDRAVKLAPSTVGAILDERFSEDELRQLLAWLESPTSKKFNQVSNDMQKALTDKLLAEIGPTLDTRFSTLQQSVAKTLGVSVPPAGAASGAKPAAAKK
ncbi:DUF2059 domain-containing protein [Paucibacter sp. APW11]|uniref:DUF2059 domain-containing protein n=1 Tax=Roseateles aquae TaxID=3077235 RepID=A0ABU3P666_9BURK|nr:DUF2059 domain-containing protein [Paucibacter sp. APW11]MDT8998067.1 DUF2059 domain-containing protein [Paucibacter sp. APW11]